MFIETGYEHDPRSSGAQCCWPCMQVRFAPLERGGPFGIRAFYKHFVPPGREPVKEILLEEQEVGPLYCREGMK
jgi:hypothetical protein